MWRSSAYLDFLFDPPIMLQPIATVVIGGDTTSIVSLAEEDEGVDGTLVKEALIGLTPASLRISLYSLTCFL